MGLFARTDQQPTPAQPEPALAAPSPVEAHALLQQRANALAASAAQTLDDEGMFRAGISQVAPFFDPSDGLARASLEAFFAQAGRRDRETVEAWFYAEALKFTDRNGIFGALTRDPERFR